MTMIEPWRLDGRTAIVTGGNGAIGQAIVATFLAAGANVVIADPAAPLKMADATIEQALHVATDITDRKAVEAMVERVSDRFGGVDILVNNAGGQVRPTRFVDMTTDMFDWEIGVNVYGTLHCSQLVARAMIERRQGAIINISSNAALKGSAGQYAACYAGCKGFVLSLAKTLAYDLAEFGIRVNTIAPGWIVPDDADAISGDSFWLRFANDMFGRPEKFEEDFQRTGQIHSVPDQPLKRIGRPRDIAAAALYFASDASAHTTGQLLSIGGGDYMPS